MIKTEKVVLPPEEILNRAADLIEKNGLARGRFCTADLGKDWTEQDCFCIAGAIAFVSGYSDHTRSATALHGAYSPSLEKEFLTTSDAFEWNDDPRTTKKMVVNRLREMAKKVSES
jgi:hypothetical protein